MNKKRKENGQVMAEYSIILAVVACIAIGGFTLMGGNANNKAKAEADIISGNLPSSTAEPTTAYWGVSTDGVLTLSTKELTASEKSKDGGTVDLTANTFTPANFNSTAWGKYRGAVLSANIKDSMAPSNTSAWFDSMTKLTSINNIQNLDTSKDTDMSVMFANCKSLTSLDVSHFDTSKVADTDGMFSGCKSLTSLDVSHFDTSNVTNMAWMFDGCRLLTSLDVSHFNTGKVTDMSFMFSGCAAHTTVDTSHFVINAGTDTANMYDEASEK